MIMRLTTRSCRLGDTISARMKRWRSSGSTVGCAIGLPAFGLCGIESARDGRRHHRTVCRLPRQSNSGKTHLATVCLTPSRHRLPVWLACFLLGLTLIIVRRIAGTTGFVIIPRRWVVERTLGWLGRWRRLSKDYEELPEVSEAMVTLAAIRMMLQRLVHPNRKRLPPP